METICPRQRNEATLEAQKRHEAHWRVDGTCSYCGSLPEEDFFSAIEGGAELVPTDKNYKAYVTVPDPRAGKPRIFSSANYRPSGDGWIEVTKDSLAELPDDADRYLGQWVQVGPCGSTKQATFYFQHLSIAGQGRLIDLVNRKAINFAYPGYFYVVPFFAARETGGNADGVC